MFLASLLRRLVRSGATLALDEPLCQIERAEEGFLLRTSKRTVNASRLLITSGGQSYPGCGTTGEGYAWARQFGHTIVAPRPALVPLTTDVPWVRELRGITVPDVALRVMESGDEAPRATKTRPLAERRILGA